MSSPFLFYFSKEIIVMAPKVVEEYSVEELDALEQEIPETLEDLVVASPPAKVKLPRFKVEKVEKVRKTSSADSFSEIAEKLSSEQRREQPTPPAPPPRDRLRTFRRQLEAFD
jgi:hypothetical protein